MLERIISLVPSITELLSDLGLDQEVAGITKFCVRPEKWFRHKIRVGGTKNLNIETIDSLQPDLIIANKEENTKEQIETLANRYNVLVTDVNDIESALAMIANLGKVTNRENEANTLIGEIEKQRAAFPPPSLPKRAAYAIWKDPFMFAGGDTFIHSMMNAAGFENVFAQEPRYPSAELHTLSSRGCDILLLSSEPFPFNEKYTPEISAELPGMEIRLVDGEMFSWYGSRMLKAFSYFESLRGSDRK